MYMINLIRKVFGNGVWLMASGASVREKLFLILTHEWRHEFEERFWISHSLIFKLKWFLLFDLTRAQTLISRWNNFLTMNFMFLFLHYMFKTFFRTESYDSAYVCHVLSFAWDRIKEIIYGVLDVHSAFQCYIGCFEFWLDDYKVMIRQLHIRDCSFHRPPVFWLQPNQCYDRFCERVVDMK